MSEEKTDIRSRIEAKWNTLNPKQQRWVIIGTVAAFGLFFIGWTIMTTPGVGPGPRHATTQGAPNVANPNVLGGGRSNVRAIEELDATIRAEAAQNRRLREQLRSEHQALQDARTDFVEWTRSAGIEREAAQARRQLQSLQQRIDELEQRAEEAESRAAGIEPFRLGFREESREAPREEVVAPEAPVTEAPAPRPEPETPRPEPSPDRGNAVLAQDLFSGTGMTPRGQDSRANNRAEEVERQLVPETRARVPERTRSGMVINGQSLEQMASTAEQERVKAEQVSAERAEQAAPASSRPSINDQLPIASVVSGVLLHGMDAPTGSGSRGQPVPVLIRIKDLAILPNNFSADIEDCHAIGAGYGSMSEERAFVRLEDIACTTPDGEVLHASMQGYIVGPDGKVGIRGPVVQRNGALIARSIQAGVLSGFGQAVGGHRHGGITLGAGERVTDDFGSVAEEGFSRGIGTAMQNVADYYLRLADAIHPVVEISSETPVDIVLTRPLELK